ncbi:MBL fold metallo-hydrolase [Photobacterium sp. MCCC 1A19761]|uniref:MBL fold metallo-hydrolase n=1 Tax=Photobacterium sp. MCCC 1A19761 TaxID=3115000 RepID=UPI00307F2B61
MMKFTQVRNATVQIEYAGQRFLVDPVLAAKAAYPGFEGTLNSHIRWPTVELPFSVEQVLDVDAVIITHTHEDHWDEAAIRMIRKDMPLFVQHEADAELVREAGFSNVTILTETDRFGEVQIAITRGQHGSDATMAVLGGLLGEVSGVVLSHPDEKTVYLAGDTVWNQHVEQAIATYRPEVIILNAGDAQIPGLGAIIMGKEDTLTVHQAAPEATIITTHLEAVNHAALSRVELREFIADHNIDPFVLVPEDGESYQL